MKPDPLSDIPKSALIWGVLGLVPVITLSVVIVHQSPKVHVEALAALLAYGAIILSFLGGVRWGIAISGFSQVPFTVQLCISVVPSLVGWVAILIERPAGLVVLTVAFSLLLLMDNMISGAPVWYSRLRLLLSLPVITCLLTVLFVQ